MKLLKDSGFPGMKVLQFAFDPHTPSIYLPHKHIENSVVYTGTHDNDTTRGWFKSLGQEDKKYIGEYLGCGEIKEEEISWIFIRAALRSVSKLAVIPMQDILDLGSEARLNAPSTFGENWKWRLQKGQASPNIAEKLARCNWMYERHIY